MKIKTFRSYIREQNILLKIPYFPIGMVGSLVGFVALYQYAFIRQTEIAEAVKANTISSADLELAISQLTSLMGHSIAAMLGAIVATSMLTAWRNVVLERGYTEQVLERMDNTLLVAVARSEEMCDDTRRLARSLLNKRSPGWSVEQRQGH